MNSVTTQTLERETEWIDDKEEKLEIALGDLAKHDERVAERIEKWWRERQRDYDGTSSSRQNYIVFLADCLANVVQILSVYEF